MTRWLAILLITAHLAIPAEWNILARTDARSSLSQSARSLAQATVDFSNVQALVQFGDRVTFQATIQPAASISQAYITIEPQGQAPLIYPLQVNEKGESAYQYDTVKNILRPFAQVRYTLKVKLTTGEEVISPDYSFNYDDTRFDWQSLDGNGFVIHWYDRELSFGQSALNIAVSGLKSAQNLLSIAPAQVVRIYVYNTSHDLQTALVGSPTWVAGHTSPDMGVILISIPPAPEDQLELERQIPHELMHILQYQLIGEKYQQQPTWLLEGMASVAEIYPDPEYARVLNQSVSAEKLLPIETLCAVFPRDAAGAFLAYAESASFVKFLYKNYGTSGLQSLMSHYHNGLGCTEGFNAAIETTLPQIELRWKQEELGINPEALIFRNLLPYILLFALVFGAAALAIVLASRR
jgi:hypothetical protein